MKYLVKTANLLGRLEMIVLVWTILGLALIGFVQVICRYIFSYSFSWFEELACYLDVFVTFLGAATAVKSGSHFAMDSLVRKLPKFPQSILRFVTSTFSGLFCLFIVYYSWRIVMRMHGFGTTSPAMQIPVYIAYLPIPIFSLLMGIRFLIRAVAYLRGLDETAAKGEPA